MIVFGIIASMCLASCVVGQRRTLSDVEYYCGNKPADVVFMLDASNSIWGPNFKRQLDFVNDVISMFQIASNVTRVGITTFSAQVYRQFYLDTYLDQADMTRAVSRISQRQGFSTNTGLAIWHMRRRMFSERHGARPNVAKVGIVLTDGQSQNIGKTIYEAIKSKRKKITMFAIGIGDRTNRRELTGIASKPTGDHMFTVDSYSVLDAIKNTLAISTCKVTTPRPLPTTTTTTTTTPRPTTPTPRPTTSTPRPTTSTPRPTTSTPRPTASTVRTTTTTIPSTTTSIYDLARRACANKRMDVVFAIDSSGNIRDDDYAREAEFFRKLAETFDVSPSETRVGSILYSDQIQEMFDIIDYDSIEGVRKGLSRLGMTAGSARIDLALKHILTKSFRRSYTRPDSSQVGIIITGSPSKYLELSKAIARKSKKAGVEYIVIGVGDASNDEELTIVSGSNDEHIFRLQNFKKLDDIIVDVALQACQVAPKHYTVQDQPCGSKQEADIMFLMDSVNAGKRNSRKALNFIKSIIRHLDIDNDNIHIGLMSAECEENIPGFRLGSHTSKAELETSFDAMKGTDFHKILHSMRRGAFRHARGGRKHAKKIAFLIIDGSLEQPLKTLTEAQRAKIHGVEVYVIQVGEEAPQEEMYMMCDAPSSQHYFRINNYNELDALKDKLLESLCDEL